MLGCIWYNFSFRLATVAFLLLIRHLLWPPLHSQKRTRILILMLQKRP